MLSTLALSHRHRHPPVPHRFDPGSTSTAQRTGCWSNRPGPAMGRSSIRPATPAHCPHTAFATLVAFVPPSEATKLRVPHTSCIVGEVSADETRSRAPLVAISRPTWGLTQALQLFDHAAPPAVVEATGGSTVIQLTQHSAAGRWGLQDDADVVLDRDRGLDEPDGYRSVVCRPPLLRGCAATLRGAPALRSPGTARTRLVDRPSAARAGPSCQPVGTHPRSSSPRVQAMTVAARQRRCFPIRIPLGPYPVVRHE